MVRGELSFDLHVRGESESQATRGSRTGFVSSVTYRRMRSREWQISNLENSDLGKQVSFMYKKHTTFLTSYHLR